jgi:hypothetical protein
MKKEKGVFVTQTKKTVIKEKNPNHLYFDYDGSNNDIPDIGEVYAVENESIIFVPDNGMKFKMKLSEFAQLRNVSENVVSKLR